MSTLQAPVSTLVLVTGSGFLFDGVSYSQGQVVQASVFGRGVERLIGVRKLQSIGTEIVTTPSADGTPFLSAEWAAAHDRVMARQAERAQASEAPLLTWDDVPVEFVIEDDAPADLEDEEVGAEEVPPEVVIEDVAPKPKAAPKPKPQAKGSKIK